MEAAWTEIVNAISEIGRIIINLFSSLRVR